MSDSLTIFGDNFTNVVGIKATGTGNGTLTYIRPTGTKSITSNGTGIDVAEYASVDVSVAGQDNTFVITVSWNSTSEMWEPDCTWAEYSAAISAGKTILVKASPSYYDAVADGSGDASGLGYHVAQTGQNNDVIVYDQTFSSSGTSLLGVNDYVYPLGSKQITANGWDIDVAGYAYADVWVTPNLQSKTHITPTTSSQTITADQNYDGLSSVQIDAMPSGAVSASATKGTVSNHAISVTPKATVGTAGYLPTGTTNGTAVSVSASELVSGTYTVDSSGTKDVTNYASASVAAGGATASATKGTVSNHSISVTPKVTRTAGWVSAGTADGTAVTVSASELVSGSETKTANGTYDVTNLAELVVSVSGGGSASIDTKTATASNYPTSISFTSMKGQPKAFFLRSTSQISSSGNTSYYYIIDMVYDGNTNKYCNGNCFRIGSTRRVDPITTSSSGGTVTGYTWSYSGTTLTITTSAASRSASPGAFNNGYQLVYVY